VKVNVFDKEWQTVVSRGDDSWRLARTGNGNTMSFHNSGTSSNPNGSINVNDGNWHHVVGTYDGFRSRLYIDGVLDVDEAATGLISMSTNPIVIGGQIHDSPDASREWNGLIDDVRVYNYALPLDDPIYPSILSLSAMGPLAASVDAGEDRTLELQLPITFVTEGTSSDNGLPGDLIYKWSTVSRPAIADANAVFTDDTALVTDVEFPEFGEWELQVTVFDVDLGIETDSSTVMLTLVSPDCSDVIAAGLLLPGDIAGGDPDIDGNPTPDCHIDLKDIAAIALLYLRCNDPLDASCEWPF
jgi:hypothetical protein